MPYHGGRRRRREWEQWRPADSGRRHRSSAWQDSDAKYGQDLVHSNHIPGEAFYNSGFAARVPMTSGMAPNSNQTMFMDGITWGGFMNPPKAATPPPLPPPPPMSNDVQLVMENMFRLRCMSPEQAERILRHTAALQGPYQD
mmetsp:Transcript_9657/g.23074  ORF Transcript_9657/g.23074 Transcript_9657/m.23074 type:complete len:142 (-) Transcript_9657:46-471(-)